MFFIRRSWLRFGSAIVCLLLICLLLIIYEIRKSDFRIEGKRDLRNKIGVLTINSVVIVRFVSKGIGTNLCAEGVGSNLLWVVWNRLVRTKTKGVKRDQT